MYSAYAYHQQDELREYLEDAFETLLEAYRSVCDLNDYLDNQEIEAIHASATLFDIVRPNSIYRKVLERHFDDCPHEKTIRSLSKDINLYKEDSPFEMIGISNHERACMEMGIYENSLFDTPHVIDAWMRLRKLGYSVIDLAKRYIAAVKKDIYSSYRRSGMSLAFRNLTHVLLDYLYDQGVSGNVIIDFCKEMRENDHGTWMDDASLFEKLLTFIETSGYVLTDFPQWYAQKYKK